MFGHPSPSPFMHLCLKVGSGQEYYRGIRTQVLLDVISSSDLKNVLAVMQEPFPALRRLRIRSEYDIQSPVISISFLGGFAPDLQYLDLTCSVSRMTEMASVCHSPRHTSPLAHSSFGIHLTRCDDHYPFRVDKARDILASIP